ncbi:reverse transcriptase [Phytophthora megakarya]|uniref:Reverse transcriptase n=1 Tax=Phytophthora megakarya TaxID=4795 RepID=A0A225VAN3_9STRA|nr:reverse transcriptase [Phytophthora megakarya]
MRSPQSSEWLAGMQREVNAMFAKGVFEIIDGNVMPTSANLLGIMWRYHVKTNPDGLRYHIFASCENGDISGGTRSCSEIKLNNLPGDIDIAYLIVQLKIRQYVRKIPDFPCPEGKVYQVNQALYGLHQSGAEWFEEVDKLLKSQGFHSTETEPLRFTR